MAEKRKEEQQERQVERQRQEARAADPQVKDVDHTSRI